MHAGIIRRYIELQALLITPIAPHWAESLWIDLLKKPSTIQNELWPTVAQPDITLSAAGEYIRSSATLVFQAEAHQVKKLQKGKQAAFDPKKDKKLTIFVAEAFPAWQEKYVQLVKGQYDATGSVDTKALTKSIDKPDMKKAMPFIQNLKRRIDTGEAATVVLSLRLAFDEVSTLKEMVPGLQQTVSKLVAVEIVSTKEGEQTGKVMFSTTEGQVGESRPLSGGALSAVPGSPGLQFENV
jgi:leucyl-tRNA synthetase